MLAIACNRCYIFLYPQHSAATWRCTDSTCAAVSCSCQTRRSAASTWVCLAGWRRARVPGRTFWDRVRRGGSFGCACDRASGPPRHDDESGTLCAGTWQRPRRDLVLKRVACARSVYVSLYTVAAFSHSSPFLYLSAHTQPTHPTPNVTGCSRSPDATS